MAELRHEARNIPSFSRSIWWKGVRDQALLVELAHIAAEYQPAHLAGYIERYGIKDERARVEIAKSAVRNGANAVGSFIDRFRIKSEKDRIEVALVVAARSASAISENIGSFRITDEHARADIALVAAQRGGRDFSRCLQNFKLSDHATILKLAHVTVGYCTTTENSSDIPAPDRSSEYIKNFRLTPAELIEVARVAAATPRSDLPLYIERYAITDQNIRRELAETSIRRNGVYAIEHIQRFRIHDPQARIALARIAVERDPSALISNIESFDIPDSASRGEIALGCATVYPSRVAQAIARFQIEDPVTRTRLARLAMRSDPVGCLPCVLNDFDLPHALLRDDIIGAGFSRICDAYNRSEHRASAVSVFGWYTKQFKQLLSSPEGLKALGADPGVIGAREPHERMRIIVDYLVKNVPNFDATLGDFLEEVQAEEILPGALAASLLTWNSCDTSGYPNRGRAALATVTGYDDLPSGKLSPNSARELWGVLLTAHELLGAPPAQRLPVSFEDRAEALRFITVGAGAVGLGSELPEYTRAPERQELRGEIERLEGILEKGFARQTGVDKLPPGSVHRLLQEWGGDITPFSILAARFRTGHGWQKELPILGMIAAQVLDGTFHERRYARVDSQLACLNDHQLQQWRENPSVLRLHTVADSEAAQATSVRENVRALFETNILHHLPEEVAHQVTVKSHAIVREFAQLSERDRARAGYGLSDIVGLLRTAIESSPDEELKQIVTAVNGLKQHVLRPLLEANPETGRQLSEDFTALKDLFRSRKGVAGQSYYVFSTITDDPKLLLMTGDLVQSASCQNFKSGSMIGTLPGYVIDGNIKLALSYVMKKQQFERALASIGFPPDTPVRVSFDAPRQQLVVRPESADSDLSASIPLGYAMRREVLRLGSHDHTGTPVLLTERAYLQPHPVDRQLTQQQRELVTAVRTAIGAQAPSNRFTTVFPPSRNPGGVYSDECGGTKLGQYDYRPHT
jgi:hypothetical protein